MFKLIKKLGKLKDLFLKENCFCHLIHAQSKVYCVRNHQGLIHNMICGFTKTQQLLSSPYICTKKYSSARASIFQLLRSFLIRIVGKNFQTSQEVYLSSWKNSDPTPGELTLHIDPTGLCQTEHKCIR